MKKVNKNKIKRIMETVEDSKINFNTFRFKIDPDLVEILTRFAYEHQFDNRKDFKEAWKLWVENHQKEINAEKSRIEEMNYKGNIEEKLFKSVRYYYKKKISIEKSREEEVEKDYKKRDYICFQTQFLEAIDNHIKDNVKDKDYSPAKGYDDFCEINTDLIKSEIIYLLEENEDLKSNEIIKKIKKAYKNRYYQIKKCN